MNPMNPAIAVISGMLTPALLILGSSSLVSAALVRLSRVVDRARQLAQMHEEELDRLRWSRQIVREWIVRYEMRGIIAERAVATLFIAICIFVLDGLAIAANNAAGNQFTWLPIGMTGLGMSLMAYAAIGMVKESRLAMKQIRDEMDKFRS